MAENLIQRRQRTEWNIKIKYSAVKFFLENPTASQKKYLADFNKKSEKKICRTTLSGWLKLANEIKNRYEAEVLSVSLGEEEKPFRKVLLTSAKTYPVTKPVADKKQESSDSSSSEEDHLKNFRPSVKNIDHFQPQMTYWNYGNKSNNQTYFAPEQASNQATYSPNKEYELLSNLPEMVLSVASPKAQEVELNELKEKLKIILTENDLKQKELINKLNKSETDYNNLLERTNKQISDLNANLEVKIFVVNSLTSKNQEFWLAYSKEKKLNDELMVKISKLNLIFRQNNEDFKNEKKFEENSEMNSVESADNVEENNTPNRKTKLVR